MMFPTGVDFRKYSDEELTTMLAEAGEASKHARKRGRVMGIVAAHRLEQVKEFLVYNELAIWRRENGFDRVMEGEESCFPGHRSLPPTPQEYYASLWCEVNALRDAISIPAKSRPRQKDSMDRTCEIRLCRDQAVHRQAMSRGGGGEGTGDCCYTRSYRAAL